MTNNDEYDYNFSTNTINSSYLFNYKDLHYKNPALIKNKLLKKIQKRSFSPLPLSYNYCFLSMRYYKDSFKGLRLNFQIHSNKNFMLNSMINIILKDYSPLFNDYHMNSLLLFPDKYLFDKKSLKTNIFVLSKLKRTGNLVQMFVDIGKQDKFIITSKDINNDNNINNLDVEYFKVLPEPLDIFNFHFKLGKHNQSLSLCTSITEGNYIGFEAAHSNHNIDIAYKYSFLLLNTLKGLKVSGVYHKTNIYLDVLYKFSKEFNMMLNYKINEFSFEEHWKLILEARWRKDRFYLSINEKLNDIHFLYNYKFNQNFRVCFSLDCNLSKIIPYERKNHKGFFNKIGLSLDFIDNN